ncbi:MAG: hypothetical protein KGL99_13610 [Burkholderiales bacterium]|nr:hypothetical protein [Burkholderiales bacterium]
MHATDTRSPGADAPQRRAAAPRASELEAATARVLTEGGDARIALSSAGVNRYGCAPRPDARLIAFGSCTASVVSAPAFAAATALHSRLRAHPGHYRDEIERLRHELRVLSGAADVPGTQVVLGASGTDLHLFAAHLAARDRGAPLQAVMAQAAETGSGVAAALSALHFGSHTCQGERVVAGAPVAAASLRAPAGVRLRDADGSVRDADAVDAEFTTHAQRIVRSGGRCLLVLTDVSKTGLLAPSPACALRLRAAFGDRLDVLVDACQFRIAPATLRGYLAHGFMVAITGSKFITGPAFSGALLLPPELAERASTLPLQALRGYSTLPDWPRRWPAAAALDDAANPGLLLRWEAALTELHRFRAVPPAAIEAFLIDWGRAVAERIAQDPCFAALPVPPLRRATSPSDGGWDHLQTIFPFVVRRVGAGGRSRPLSADETALLYRRLQASDLAPPPRASEPPARGLRVQLGQPVPCGPRDGVPVSALRICASARWVADAAGSPHGTGHAVRQAMRAFDRLALLAQQLDGDFDAAACGTPRDASMAA